MSYFYNAVFFIFVLASFSFAWARPLIDLTAKTRISKDEAAIFSARILEPGIRKIRLRYKISLEDEYSWVDFEPDGKGNFRATVAPSLVTNTSLYYYVVSKNDKGVVEAIYGTPSEPHRINVDRRPVNGVLHQHSRDRTSPLPMMSVKDRFGDDEAKEQISIFSASDAAAIGLRPQNIPSLGPKMSAERIEQMGARDLVDLLRSFPNLDFMSNPQKVMQPVLSGVSAHSRLKLRIDEIEVSDEFDGFSSWRMDAINSVGIAVLDGPIDLVGESNGLLGEVRVETPKSAGLTVRIRSGWPYEVATGFVAGGGLGRFENYWTGALRHDPSSLIASSHLKTEYWLPAAKRPFLTGRVHFFGTVPARQYAQRYLWNGSIKFEFPFSSSINSRLTFHTGQTFVEQGELEKRNYRLLRAGLEFENDFRLHRSHLLSLNASGAFIALANSSFHFDDTLLSGEKLGFELTSCDVLGIKTSAAANCRLKGNLTSRYRFQLTHWAATSAALGFSAATKEINDLRSMLHPSVVFELSPRTNINLNVGYSSSVRWPTFLEKSAFVKGEWDAQLPRQGEVSLASEKLRQLMLQVKWRLESDYAHLTLDAQGRTGWLEDQIVLNPSLAKGRGFLNRGSTRFSALRLGATTKLASGNQIYFGSELHTQSIVFPSFKFVLGTRFNLGVYGSAHLEIQSLADVNQSQLSTTRIKTFYQTRLLFNHLLFEAHAAQAFSNQNANDYDFFSGIFASAKVVL